MFPRVCQQDFNRLAEIWFLRVWVISRYFGWKQSPVATGNDADEKKKDSIWWVNHKSKTTGLKEKLKCSTELRQVVNFCVSNNCHLSYANNIKLYQYINDERANDKMLSHFSGCFGKHLQFQCFRSRGTPSRNFKRPTDGAFIKEAFMCLFPERNPDSPWI